MKQRILNNKKTIIDVFILFIITIVIFFPMFTKPYKICADTEFHASNIAVTKEKIEQNFLFPDKIIGKIGNNFGYGTRLFYPPLPHLSTAYLDIVIDNTAVSMKIAYFLAIFTSGLSMYFLSKKISKNNTVGLISAVIYMLFPYHLSNMYIRDAMAEAFLFTFLPLIISGLFELLYGKGKRFYLLFVFGYVGGLLCHINLMTYFTVLLFIFLGFHFKKVIIKENFSKICIASLFILGITSCFWITLLEHNLLGNYVVFKQEIMVQGTQGNGITLGSYFNYSVNDVHDIRFFFDFLSIILCGITICVYKKLDKSKVYFPIIILGIISIILSLSSFPWDILPKSLRIIQFPYHMLTFVALFFSLIAPLCLLKLQGKLKSIVSTFTILFMLFSFLVYFQVRPDWDLNMDNLNYSRGLGYQFEYLPVKLYEKKDYLDKRVPGIIVKDNESVVEIIEDNVPYLKFKVNGEATVEFPRIYYIGYSLKNIDGKEMAIYENENGFIESKIGTGTYVLKHPGTTLDIICNYLSLVSLIGFIIFVGGKYGKN